MVVAGWVPLKAFLSLLLQEAVWPRAGTPGTGHRGSLGSHIFPASSLFSLCSLCALTLVFRVLMKSGGNNPARVQGQRAFWSGRGAVVTELNPGSRAHPVSLSVAGAV